MPTRIDKLGSWRQTYATIDANIQMNIEFLTTAPYSDDPDSDYQRAQKNVEELYDKLRLHAVVGLKLIDEETANCGVLEQLAELSRQAKEEAERVKQLTKTIENLTCSIQKVTSVVNKFMSLPFISLV